MTLPPIDVVPLFPDERDALLTLLATRNAEEWFTPTVCAGWTVHDVALHLLGADVNVLSGDRDHFGGPLTDAPRPNLSDWDTLVNFINGRNELWVDALRRVSPRLTRELLAVTGPAVASYFQTVDLTATGNLVNWAGPEPAPVWLHIAREYTERWTHQQHIRDAVGQPGLIEPRWFAPVLDTFARALPYTLRAFVAEAGDAVSLRVTGEAGGVWTAVWNGVGGILFSTTRAALSPR